jgi:hypothetical protein
MDPRRADVIGNFVAEAQAHLESLLDLSGEILFSAVDTLKEGDLYICGLNPGGVGDAPHHHTIREDLGMLPHKTSNNYLDESWGQSGRRYPRGAAPLQRRLQWLVRELGYNLREVCASNLIFARSRGEGGSGYPEYARICWPVHERILRIVRPKMLLVFGSGVKSPFEFLQQNSKRLSKADSIYSGHSPWYCKAFRAEIGDQEIVVVGLPHLSRYKVVGKDQVVEWIAGHLTNYLKTLTIGYHRR